MSDTTNTIPSEPRAATVTIFTHFLGCPKCHTLPNSEYMSCLCGLIGPKYQD